jgi:hypothetical protein
VLIHDEPADPARLGVPPARCRRARHNGRVPRRVVPPALAALTLGLTLALTLGLTGCGSDSSTPSSGGTTGSPSSTGTATGASTTGATSAPPVVVQGVSLTAQGTQLRLGRTARVGWHPTKTTVGVAAITVTRLQKVPMSAFSDWRLDPATRRSTPYFVHATVRNLGRSDLSGTPVPLYLLDQHDTLLQASSFQAEYARCPSRPLPARFTRGKRTGVCLVYFVPDHGRLVAVSFRPSQDFQAITWTGRIGTGG